MPDAPALLPCPLCNQAAHFFRIDDHDSREFGGEGICCETTGCAQIGLMFPVMEDVKPLLRERWNRRPPSPACEGVSAEPIAGQRITAALQDPGCERLREWAAIGPVQRAAVELFADLIAATPPAPPVAPVAWVEAEPSAANFPPAEILRGMLLSTQWHWQSDRPTQRPGNVLVAVYAAAPTVGGLALIERDLLAIADRFGQRWQAPDEEGISFEKSRFFDFLGAILAAAGIKDTNG